MSGIYGFTYRNADAVHLKEALEGLEHWNRMYGSKANEHRIWEYTAIGCCIEHFTDAFPYGGPVLSCRFGSAVVDALLYNRDELLTMIADDTPDTVSDEELLLKLIEQKGFDILAQVNGDFAGAIYDFQSEEWILFRDHFGVRPLYYYLDDDLFGFATCMRGLAALPGSDCSPNEQMLHAKLTGAVSLTPQTTEYAHIHCVLPATVTRFKMTDRSITRTEYVYWRYRRKKIRFHSDDEYRQELLRLITDAVNRRCDAIPGILGAELSGGLDSTVIDILINRHGREARFYSWSYDPSIIPIKSERDERILVLDVCAQEGIECRFRLPSDHQPKHSPSVTLMPPMANTQVISYSSAWLKSQGANVVFSGHGGDEGVSHRASRFELFYNREFLSYFKLFWLDAKGRRLRLLRALKWSFSDAWTRMKSGKHFREDLEFYNRTMDRGFISRMADTHVDRKLPFNYAPHTYVSLGGSRPRMDTCAFQGALNGVRYIFPYMDYRVMDYALSIPRRLFVSQNDNRTIFKETFREILPPSMRGTVMKSTVSLADYSSDVDFAEHFRQNKELLLKRLDRDYWNNILDFAGIEALEPACEQYDHTDLMLDRIMSTLWQCVSIQRFQNRARAWREEDERDKTV